MNYFTIPYTLLVLTLITATVSQASTIDSTYTKLTESKSLSIFDVNLTPVTKKSNIEIIEIYEDSIIYSVSQQADGNAFREDIWFYDRNNQQSTPIGEKFKDYAPKVVNYVNINGKKFIFNELSENDQCELILLEKNNTKNLLRDVSCDSGSLEVNGNNLYIAKTRFYYDKLRSFDTYELYDRKGYNIDGLLIHYNFSTNESQEVIHTNIGSSSLPYVSEVITAGSYLYTFQCQVKSGCKNGNYGAFNRYSNDFTSELTLSRQNGDNLLHIASNSTTDSVYIYDENKLYGNNRLIVSKNESSFDIIEDTKPARTSNIISAGVMDDKFRLLNISSDTQLGETILELVTFDDESQSFISTKVATNNIIDTSSKIFNNEAFIIDIHSDSTRDLNLLSLDGTIQHLFKLPVSSSYAINILDTDSNSILFSQNGYYWEFDRNSETLSQIELKEEGVSSDRNTSLENIVPFDFAGEKFFLIATDNPNYNLWYYDSVANTVNQLSDAVFTDALPEQSQNNLLILKNRNQFTTYDVNTKAFIQHELLTGLKQISPLHFSENFTFISESSDGSIKKWQYDWGTKELDELETYNNNKIRYASIDYVWFMQSETIYAYSKNDLTLYELIDGNINTVFSAENQGITDKFRCENCIYKHKDRVYIFGAQWYYDFSSPDNGEINFYGSGEKKEPITNAFSHNEDLYFIPHSFNSIYKLENDTDEVSNLPLQNIIGDKIISIPFSSTLKVTSFHNRNIKTYDISEDFSNIFEIYSNNDFQEVSLSSINSVVNNISKLVLNAEDAMVNNTYTGRELAILNLYTYKLADFVNEMPEEFELSANDEFEFIPTIEQPTSLPLSFTIMNTPEWLKVNKESGVLFGTPSDKDIGLFSNIKLVVDNGFDTYTWNFSIDIKASNDTVIEEPKNSSGGSTGILLYLILSTLYTGKNINLKAFRK